MEKATANSTLPEKSNIILHRNEPDCSIVEILTPKDNDIDNDDVRVIEAFCVHVEPRACSRVVKQLSSTLPLEDCLAHLKRVRRRPLLMTATTEIKSLSTKVAEKEKKQSTSVCERSDYGGRSPATGSEVFPTTKKPTKRRKQNILLEILIGTHLRLQENNESSVENHPIIREFGPLHSVMVPKYEPRSEQEWKNHNLSWPTLYHPLKFEEHKNQKSALSGSELSQMQQLMEKCISTRSVLIVDPNNYDHQRVASNTSENIKALNDDTTIDLAIVSISRDEQSLQDRVSYQQQRQHDGSTVSLLGNNPLATPVILALQGVSRRERHAKINAIGLIAVDDPSIDLNLEKSQQKQHKENQSQKKRGQYICTGYDMYCYYEPNVFEAMASLHSRLRRLVYFVPDCHSTLFSSSKNASNDENRIHDIDTGAVVWEGGLSRHGIHHLPGTNHNYRAFEYRQSSYKL